MCCMLRLFSIPLWKTKALNLGVWGRAPRVNTEVKICVAYTEKRNTIAANI